MNAVPERQITAGSVLDAIKEYVAQGSDHFTTMEIARQMNCGEYQVRAAISWLARGRTVETVKGVRSQRYTKEHGEAYSAAVYQLCEHYGPPDLATLQKVFCGGCSR